jgi:hypothetical protein
MKKSNELPQKCGAGYQPAAALQGGLLQEKKILLGSRPLANPARGLLIN